MEAKKHNERNAGRKTLGDKPKKAINVMIDVDLLETVKQMGNVSAAIDAALRSYLNR